MIVEQGSADTAIYAPPEIVEELIALVPQAEKEAELRYSFFLGRHSIDIPLLREGCLTKDCIRKKIEYHKEKNIAAYNLTLQKTRELFLGDAYEMGITANHRFYDVIIEDCIKVVEAFNDSWELSLWYDVWEEYIEKYPDYGEQFTEDPLGFVVGRTVKPIVDIGASVFKGVVSGTSEALFGADWKKKILIGGVIIGGVAIGGLVLYSFGKSFVSEKARIKARGKKNDGKD